MFLRVRVTVRVRMVRVRMVRVRMVRVRMVRVRAGYGICIYSW